MLKRREFLQMLAVAAARPATERVPDKLVALTFDDAVKSHRTFVAPLLKELGFGATFFITHRWMGDAENFLTWQEVAEIHEMGFEIGNHSWTHANFASPRSAARLASELALVEWELARTPAKIPRPVSFAYSGNGFGPEAVQRLAELGCKFARRGMQPEVPYGEIRPGPTFDPKKHHPLLIPTSGDAYPGWTLEHFQKVVAQATGGQIVVLQFHGVPDTAHLWVHTPPERFREYMAHLKQHGFRAIALRDLERYVDLANPPADPLLAARHPMPKDGRLQFPVEVEATRQEPKYWLENMLVHHRFTLAEAAQACGWSEDEVKKKAAELGILSSTAAASSAAGRIRVLPYPGGRQVRMGFFANLDPHRGTKASVFLPWDGGGYVVVDLPEAVFSGRNLIYLAHTHIPTIWDQQNIVLENIDWNRERGGELRHRRVLPNQVALGAAIRPQGEKVAMELWLRNGSDQPLAALRTQVCVLLKGAPEFNAQTTDNKVLRCPAAAVRSAKGDRWILTAWERCGRAWGQPLVPCLHADPVLPDCPPGETVRVRGWLWFYEGRDVEPELERAKQLLA